MPNCVECFCESGRSGRELQLLVDEIHPNFTCEGEACSPFSPRPVADNETLAFILIDPIHYDDERQVVVPEAFQELTKRDLSTLRIDHASKSEADATREQLIARNINRSHENMRSVNEVCIASVVEFRSAIDATGQRILAVYDTALEHVPAHASVFTRADVLTKRQLRKLVRNRIHEIFTKRRIPYSNFREALREAA